MMNNTLSSNPDNSASSSSTTTKRDDVLISDLLSALADDQLLDVFLVSSDGAEVPASRFVLAARSPVLKRMLYGSFREAKSSTICCMGYSSCILKAVVQYCRCNGIHEFVSTIDDIYTEAGVRRLVDLSKAADYLQLVGLRDLTDALVRKIMATPSYEPLACAVLDQVAVGGNDQLWQTAMTLIECRPYVSLDSTGSSGGGVESLGGDRLLDVMKNPSIACGELFLFHMIQRWFEHHSSSFHNNNRDAALDVAHQCCRCLHLEYIEPQALLEEVQSAPFVSPEWIFTAVAKQALRASQQGVWSLGCRRSISSSSLSTSNGNTTTQSTTKAYRDRILVEHAGSRDANGMYYRVAYLAQHHAACGLYSKREVACGQQRVYTLSVSLQVKGDLPQAQIPQADNNSNDDAASSSSQEQQPQSYYEYRLFCTMLLTNRAVETLRRMQETSGMDPVFQPVLQVLSIEPPTPSEHSSLLPGGCKYHRARLSDGHLHMHATFAFAATAAAAQHQHPSEPCSIRENAIIKVLEFALYHHTDGCPGIHVIKLSVVHSNPGLQFGNPVATSACSEDDCNVYSKDDDANDDDSSNNNGLQSLYSCRTAVLANNYNAYQNNGFRGGAAASDFVVVPRSGWNVEDHGLSPSPTCTWIPAANSSSLPFSSSNLPELTGSLSSAERSTASTTIATTTTTTATSPTSVVAQPF